MPTSKKRSFDLKNRSWIIIAVTAIVFLAISIKWGQTLANVKAQLDQERYQRINAEEQLEKTKLQLQPLESALKEAQERTKNIQSILEKEKVTNEKLKSEFTDLMRSKEDLQKKLSETIAAPVTQTQTVK